MFNNKLYYSTTAANDYQKSIVSAHAIFSDNVIRNNVFIVYLSLQQRISICL